MLGRMTETPQEVTQLLAAWRGGDQAAFDRLAPIVYDELRRLARGYMRRERDGQTLQPTALVNEAFLRLVKQQEIDWQGRAHFFAIAALIMRRFLIDRARAKQYEKRGGGAQQVELAEGDAATPGASVDVLALHEALERLAAIDPRKSRIVELRYFGGLSVEETAEVLGISAITVKREWGKAKAWLYREIRQEQPGELGTMETD